MTNQAKQAIGRSISHNEIVTIDHDQHDYDALVSACDDMAQHGEPDGLTEFWGTDDDGNTWRVHMRASLEG